MKRLHLVYIFTFLQFGAWSQWINEIHYDNSGGDVNECVEVVAPAGTNMTCYQIILYNGSNGQTYYTGTFTGTMLDEGCGYGAAAHCGMSSIQNGSPDGIVLYNVCTATVIQFLSYEGSFTATNGVANGMTSTDIGVAEGGGTLGSSLQLTGSGNTYGSFAWQTEGPASSMGTLNAGQSISPCGSNTITTGTVTGTPFTVDCVASTTDAGTVDFTSTGTFAAGNVYTAQLSDASGSFASPIAIGTLTSTANSGTINITIPETMDTGTGYLIRVVSDNPTTTGSSSTAFTITQNDQCGTPLPSSSGLIINEWSNGDSGNREYYEFVVAGQCGDLVDIRGFILDDNNATFTDPSDYDATASGIAGGHFRFALDPQWASIPVGSLILIYNADDPNLDLPADDPTDANSDSLYVVPHNNALFERCTSMPTSSSPDSTYTPCTYATAPLTGWSPLSLRNSGDAIQVRNPDGTYYHGVSYGGSEITGGPDGLKQFTGSGSNSCGWFSDGDFRDISNWSSGTADLATQTAGVANDAANLAWLLEMRDPTTVDCPVTVLPVEITLFEGWTESYGNKLIWETATEQNSDYFIIERSIDGKHWTQIQTVNSVGDSQATSKYQVVDSDFEEVINYYQLKQYDNDGTEKRHHKLVTIDNRFEEAVILVGIYNLLGQQVDQHYEGVQIHVYSDGTSKRVLKM